MPLEPRTPFCRELGIDYPICSVGFGSGAGPELVAAVSNAGGFGVLGASGVPLDRLRWLFGRTRELTDRPFGINIILGDDEDLADDEREFLRHQTRRQRHQARRRDRANARPRCRGGTRLTTRERARLRPPVGGATACAAGANCRQ